MEIESAGPGETRGEAFINGFNLGGEAVASDDDLFIELIEVVEDIEEFFLGFFLVDDELEVVDDENVEFAEFEVEFLAFAEFDGVDEVGVEVRNWGVENLEGGVFAEKFVTDGLDEVGFTKTRTAIEEKGVVAAARSVDDAASGGDREVVVGADDEVFESVFFVEIGLIGGGFFQATLGAFDAVPERSFVFGSNFARSDTRFRGGLDLEIDGFHSDVVVGESDFDEIKVAAAELADEERVFYADTDFAVFGREKGGVLKPSGVVTTADFLLDFS